MPIQIYIMLYFNNECVNFAPTKPVLFRMNKAIMYPSPETSESEKL